MSGATWSLARDVVARELFERFALFSSTRPEPSWHDLDNNAREAWAQVADRAVELAASRAVIEPGVRGPLLDTYRDAIGAKGEPELAGDRAARVYTNETTQGPEIVVDEDPDTREVRVFPRYAGDPDRRGKRRETDRNLVEPLVFHRASGGYHRAIVTLHAILCAESNDLASSPGLERVLVDLDADGDTVAALDATTPNGTAAIDDDTARALYYGEGR